MLDTTEYYNPRTDSWQFIPSLRFGRIGVATASHRGMVFAAGGYSDEFKQPVLRTVGCFDPARNRYVDGIHTFESLKKLSSGSTILSIITLELRRIWQNVRKGVLGNVQNDIPLSNIFITLLFLQEFINNVFRLL